LSENRPEWAMAYFGILKAGATAVPLDANLSLAEIENLRRASKAKVLLASPRQLDRLNGVDAVPLVDALRGARDESKLPPLKKAAAADEVASLLFTSGTTGKPKGVLLTHRNFASLAAKLASLFDLHVGEGVLSVLPLHHTFEFSCGLLTPLTLGAEITYLDELTADRLGEALESNDIHAMIGVPALWQLLHRRLTGEIASKPTAVRAAAEAAMALHGELRNRTPFNVGKLLFWPVHRRLGGKLRLLVSGGSALPAEIHEAFHQLGFDLTEGYGLTEAAPVLAVTVPENKRRTGTVGPAIPGVEIKIRNPDSEGVGEVIAKGPNVMAGYLDDPGSTGEVLIDGWLHTGDLGKLTGDGNLVLVGRKKDVILDASGKNVYPDELEELYGANPVVKELCVVGLPDEQGHETIACLAVARAPKEGETRDQVRAELHEHFAKASASLPFWKRIKALHLWDAELPRTATRKVKRPLVLAELQRLERTAQAARKHHGTALASGERGHAWLYDLVAELARKPRSTIGPETRFAVDLGFDSLLTAELVSAIEKAGLVPPEEGRIVTLQTVGDLAAALEQREDATAEAGSRKPEALEEITVPEPIAVLGRKAIDTWQTLLYERFFELDVKGRSNVPPNAPFLVAANHSSHLDVGLVKQALGDQGKKLASLAARDYFFDTPWKRAWFGSFTNLVPLDRHGSLKESLRTAAETLRLGYHLLIFPEGTRSPDGTLQEFKPAIAYLSFATGANIVPMWLEGAHDAMPKGAFAPDPRKRKKLEVRIGPPLRHDDLRAATAGMSRSAAHREVTRLVRLAVEALRDGTPPPKVEGAQP
jgi:long-chain acyl-CoA synthetase